MSTSAKKIAALSLLRKSPDALTLAELSLLLAHSIPDRTLRRWLANWVESGVLQRIGQKRGTRYQFISDKNYIAQNKATYSSKKQPHFIQSIPKHRRDALLEQLRDLWTHSSTSLEGNTLSLGDTHAILGLGLTISGKPLREHQEIIGHAQAIELIYQSLQHPIDKALIYALHRAVQTDITIDIYKPIGAWKVEKNGTYAISSQGKQVFIEYAHPLHVEALMDALIQEMNTLEFEKITLDNAAYYYAKFHMALVHIHPFWDGNGRIARLVANLILLKAGLPPLVINHSLRREYIQYLADYQLQIGALTTQSGLWPKPKLLANFQQFCQQSYQSTQDLIAQAKNPLK